MEEIIFFFSKVEKEMLMKVFGNLDQIMQWADLGFLSLFVIILLDPIQGFGGVHRTIGRRCAYLNLLYCQTGLENPNDMVLVFIRLKGEA